MVKVTQGEIWALNVLTTTTQNAQEELQRTTAARNSFVELLELKYNAKLNPATGQLEEKEKDKTSESKQEIQKLKVS